MDQWLLSSLPCSSPSSSSSSSSSPSWPLLPPLLCTLLCTLLCPLQFQHLIWIFMSLLELGQHHVPMFPGSAIINEPSLPRLPPPCPLSLWLRLTPGWLWPSTVTIRSHRNAHRAPKWQTRRLVLCAMITVSWNITNYIRSVKMCVFRLSVCYHWLTSSPRPCL